MTASATLRIALPCCFLLSPLAALADEPPPPQDAATIAQRNAQKIPTKIAGELRGGKLVELRVRDRSACLFVPYE
jgi:hypothetical protein